VDTSSKKSKRADKIKLYRCGEHSAWISPEQCERNRDAEEASKVKTVIAGLPTCRECPGILELPNVETKQVERRTRTGLFRPSGRKKLTPSARSTLHQTMKKRLAKEKMETDAE
jgi:hypothetical protein